MVIRQSNSVVNKIFKSNPHPSPMIPRQPTSLLSDMGCAKSAARLDNNAQIPFWISGVTPQTSTS